MRNFESFFDNIAALIFLMFLDTAFPSPPPLPNFYAIKNAIFELKFWETTSSEGLASLVKGLNLSRGLSLAIS